MKQHSIVKFDDVEKRTNEESNCKPLIFPQVKCVLISSIGLLIAGSVGSWTGSSLTELNEEFSMSTTESSLVVSLYSYGSLVGSLLSGKAMDIFGRKKVMLGATPLATCGWAVIGIATNVNIVYIGRFMCGLSAGALFSSISIYTSEVCQASLRGRLGSLPALNLSSGILLSYVLGGFFSWQISSFLCVIPTVAFFVGLFFIPESPYWFLLKGNHKAATESLRELRGPNYIIENEIKKATQKISDVGTNISYLEFLERRTMRPLLVSLFIQTLQQLCGGNIIIIYTSTIFKSANSSIDEQMATIFTGVAQLIGTVVSMFVIDKFGRRVLLFMSITCCGIFIALLGGYYLALSQKNFWPAWLPLMTLLCYLFAFCLGCRSVPWLIGSEIFNTSIRSRAQSISLGYNRILSLIVIQAYPYVVHGVGEAVVFLSYGVLCFLFAVGTLLFVPETKGKSLEEIQDYFEVKASLKMVEKETLVVK